MTATASRPDTATDTTDATATATAASATRSQPGTGRRVLIVVQNLPVPFDRRVWLEATTLADHGYAVSVICPQARGCTAARETIDGVDIYRYPLPFEAGNAIGWIAEFVWCFVATALLSIRVAVRGRGFDVLHACNPPETYVVLGKLWRPFGKRFLFDHHDLSPEMYLAKGGRAGSALHRGLLALERLTLRNADVVITTNESHARLEHERGGVPEGSSIVVRSGPNLAKFRRTDPDPSLKQGRRHLLAYLGVIGDQDGVDHLVRAMLALRRGGREDVHCLVIGDGPHFPAIRKLATELGVDDLITFTGFVRDVDELCRLLSSADLGVVPDPRTEWSDRSTLNKVVEYMYFGLPVVSYELTETKVSAGGAARFAESDDVDDLAATIAALLDDPAERARMGAIGAERVRSELAWEHSIPHLLEAYDRAFAFD